LDASTRDAGEFRERSGKAAAPFISVLMPVFNSSDYLPEAVASVTSQTCSSFELVVVDDGSSDGSLALLRKYASSDRRFRLVSRENRGLIATRNELLSLAQGEFVAWMDSDDVSARDRLARQLSAFESDPTLVCVGGAAQCIDPEGNYLNVERYPASHEEIVIEQMKGGAMRFPTTMMRRTAALQVGGFREPFRIGEDLDFLLRLSQLGRMSNLPDVIYLYRQHLASVCKQLGSQWIEYRDCILDLARERDSHGQDRLQSGGTVSLSMLPTVPTRRLASQTFAEWAAYAKENGDGALARRYAKAAVVALPWSMAGWKAMVSVFRANSYRWR
jgi:glycosyltransferase involved in cell wall biosynthesis